MAIYLDPTTTAKPTNYLWVANSEALSSSPASGLVYNGRIETFDSTGTRSRTNYKVGFKHPYGIALDPNQNRAYILDKDNDRVVYMPFTPFPASDDAVTFFAGGRSPQGIAVQYVPETSESFVYVAYTGDSNVKRYSYEDGSGYIEIFGNGTAQSFVQQPQGVAVVNKADSPVWVIDRATDPSYQQNRLQIYYSDTSFKMVDNLNQPNGIAINPTSGTIFISEEGNQRINTFFDLDAWVQSGKAMLRYLPLNLQGKTLDLTTGDLNRQLVVTANGTGGDNISLPDGAIPGLRTLSMIYRPNLSYS